jgi:hypothetical protein
LQESTLLLVIISLREKEAHADNLANKALEVPRLDKGIALCLQDFSVRFQTVDQQDLGIPKVKIPDQWSIWPPPRP